MPRHPSCALSSLTTKKQINFVLQSLNISCLSNCKLLCNPSSCRLLTNLFFSCQSTPRSLADFSLNNQVNLYLRVKLVGVLGFEPRTSSLSGTRSNQLSYTPAGSSCELYVIRALPIISWWSRRGSNPRHPACKAGALAN